MNDSELKKKRNGRLSKRSYSRFSLPVLKAVDLIWTSFDREEMRRGYKMLVQAAEQGDADALCFIARCHMGAQYVWSGGGFAVDDTNASVMMQRSAVKGSASGVLCCVRSGNFTPAVQRDMPFVSFKEAFDDIREHADRGNAFCCYMIGNAFFYGDYLMAYPELAKKYKDLNAYNAFAYPMARHYYERSFHGRVCAGYGNYIDIMESGLADIPKETYEAYSRALAEISPLVCALYGSYVFSQLKNPELAVSYFIKSAQRGEPHGIYLLGVSYQIGKGIEEDYSKAMELYKIAATGNHPGAQWQLGQAYFYGWEHVEQDYGTAVEWFLKAYDNPTDGCRLAAAAYLGICYQDGLGVEQDDDVAYGYLEKVEDSLDSIKDDPVIGLLFNALGVAYAYGRGTDKDVVSGLRFFEKAVENGCEEAGEHLAHLAQLPDKKDADAFYRDLSERIRKASESDLREVLAQIGDEHIYAAALVLDWDYRSLALAVNTTEYLNENFGPGCEEKWFLEEWGYSDDHGELADLSALLWKHHDYSPDKEFFFDAVFSAMKQLKESYAFGPDSENVTCFVSISDEKEAERVENMSAQWLNSPELAAEFLKRNE